MVDNRIVINNHLARGRGGKISFTHLIGFAMVEALAEMPAMNTSYTLADDKPSVLTPAHVNVGIAIDLAKPDGTRQLLVPSIKKCETLDFAGFWSAYEDVVRRARGNKLDGRRLRGHDDLADQPRHHRHGPLGPAPDAGAGHDHRRRRHGLPGGVRGHVRGAR